MKIDKYMKTENQNIEMKNLKIVFLTNNLT